MKNILAEVVKTPNETIHVNFVVNNADGSIDAPTTNTLLEFIQEAHNHLHEIESLLESSIIDKPVSQWPYMPNWGINDINLWLNSPSSMDGYLCITNENTLYHSDEGGFPQEFTFEQFHTALNHWRSFMSIVEKQDKKLSVGYRFEAPWLDDNSLLELIIEKAAASKSDNDYNMFFQQAIGKELYFCCKRNTEGQVHVPFAKVGNNLCAVVFFSSSDNEYLNEEYGGIIWEKALEMVLKMPNADGLMVQNKSDAWIGIQREKIKELLSLYGV